MKKSARTRKIRYAVVGIGHIAQFAVLPGMVGAKSNSECVALVSGDPLKLKKLAKKYGIQHTFSYEEYDNCLKSGLVDAVYIALPNDMHLDFSNRAAQHGIHILCEKPLAVTARDARTMMKVAEQNNVRLMTAYRLHFEHANLEAIKIASSGKLGELRYFNSSFSQQVDNHNIRLHRKDGGGPVYDMGVYCINASRYLFREVPDEVFASSSKGPDSGDPRFKEIDEMTSAIMRYPDGKIAHFITSLGATSESWYKVTGTKGHMTVSQAYGYESDIKIEVVTADGKTLKKTFKKSGQFAAEIAYFSDCLLKNKDPEPNGLEGVIDVQIIEAIMKSSRTNRPVRLQLEDKRHPSMRQHIYRRPPKKEPKVIHAHSPTRNN